jgi:GAF domain-containing protein
MSPLSYYITDLQGMGTRGSSQEMNAKGENPPAPGISMDSARTERIDPSGIFAPFLSRLSEKGFHFPPDQEEAILRLIRDEVLYHFVDSLITHVDTILEINPSLPEKEILQGLLKGIVDFLGVEAATIRIYDPRSRAMILNACYPGQLADWPEGIPLDNTVTGTVIKTQQSYFIPDIQQDDRFHNKKIAREFGLHTMLAIPISLPRFSLKDIDTEGVLSLYYSEKDRKFSPLETKIAEMFSRRVSYVIARKRIQDLQQLNEAKDRIIDQIFLKIGRREGIKMKEVFNLVVPELAGIMKIQRCSLFSLMEDQQHVVLEAGYPEAKHGIGTVFSIQEPYIAALVNPQGPFGDFGDDEIHRDYILVKNPKRSRLLSEALKNFLVSQGIHSVLYIPLRVQEEVKYFLVFDAESPQDFFTKEKIEIFSFLGKELMKGLRLERMDDLVHDFKNPAIAVAGFARRIKKMLEEGQFPSKEEKIFQYLDIVIQESLRLQDLALSLYGEGKEGIVDLTDRLKKRFLLNGETIRELGRTGIRPQEKDMVSPLWIRCFPLHIDRVLDNLLNNATAAIPEDGGELSIRSYRRDSWAVAEIQNSGFLSSEEKERILQGECRGRGLHITQRLIKQMGGKIEVESEEGKTIFRILIPLVNP